MNIVLAFDRLWGMNFMIFLYKFVLQIVSYKKFIGVLLLYINRLANFAKVYRHFLAHPQKIEKFLARFWKKEKKNWRISRDCKLSEDKF